MFAWSPCVAAMLVIIAFVFLGEYPSPLGLAGVGIITLGGYLLSRQKVLAAGGPVPKGGSPGHQSQPPSDPDDKASKAAMWPWRSGVGPLLPNEAVAPALLSASGSASALKQAQHPGTLLISVHKAHSRNGSHANLHAPPASSDVEAAPSDSEAASMASGGGGRKGSAREAAASSRGVVPSEAREQAAASSKKKGTRAAAAAALAADVESRGCCSSMRALSQQPGSLLMIGVASLWSVTATLDKVSRRDSEIS